MIKKNSVALLIICLSLVISQFCSAVPIWPDRVEPTMRLAEALNIAKTKLVEYEDDFVYCINAVLKNGENNDTATGYWELSYATELGNSYAVFVRVDGRVDVQKIKAIGNKGMWPTNISPPLMLDAALTQAQGKLSTKKKHLHYCLVATLVTTKQDDVYKGGMWNLIFQNTANDPQKVQVKMNGKTKITAIGKIRQITGE